VCFDKIFTYGLIRCGHLFCFNCIRAWAQEVNKCPLCKLKFNVIKKVSSQETEFVRVHDKDIDVNDDEIDPALFGQLISKRPLLCMQAARR